MIDLSNVRLQLATISSPRKEPKVSTFWRGGGKRRLEVVEVAEEGVGVERGGSEAAVGGGGGGCWEDTWDVGGTPPTPWGEAVEARCRGDDSPPATTKNTREARQARISRTLTLKETLRRHARFGGSGSFCYTNFSIARVRAGASLFYFPGTSRRPAPRRSLRHPPATTADDRDSLSRCFVGKS